MSCVSAPGRPFPQPRQNCGSFVTVPVAVNVAWAVASGANDTSTGWAGPGMKQCADVIITVGETRKPEQRSLPPALLNCSMNPTYG